MGLFFYYLLLLLLCLASIQQQQQLTTLTQRKIHWFDTTLMQNDATGHIHNIDAAHAHVCTH